MTTRSRIWVVCALIGAAFAAFAAAVQAQDVVISQVYSGAGCTTTGCSAYNNDHVVLFNKGQTSATLPAWSVQYASAGGTSWSAAPLPANSVIPAGGYFLVKLGGNTNGLADLPAPIDATGSLNLSASSGKIALVKSATALSGTITLPNANIADFVGYGTSASLSEGNHPAPAPGSNSNAIFRKDSGCQETNDNAADFEALSAAPRNSASPTHVCPPVPTLSASAVADPNTVYAGNPVVLTVTVNGGILPYSVRGDLGAIGGVSNQQFYDDGTHGDVSNNDKTFTFATTVSCTATLGSIAIPVTVTDSADPAATATPSIALTVNDGTPELGAPHVSGLPDDNGEPQDATRCPGETATFSVVAHGGNLSYQWYNGAGQPLTDAGNITGATTDSLRITNVQAADAAAGPYRCVVSGCGTNPAQTRNAALTIGTAATAADKQIVISQVYGGGGNADSYYKYDFIELFNKGDTPVNVTGWSVQYAGATTGGSQPAFDRPARVTVLSGTIQPHKFFLIQEVAGTTQGGGTAPLPTPDVDGIAQPNGGIGISATAGKVALVNNSTPLAEVSAYGTGTAPTALNIVDFVGYGNTTNIPGCAEGSNPATLTAGTGNFTAVVRKSACTDTDNNGNDFMMADPLPHNSSSATAPGIITQPSDQLACAGGTATFRIVPGGACLTSFQWQVKLATPPSSPWENATTGTGFDTPEYTTPTLASTDAGNQYRCIVTGIFGSPATSNAATLSLGLTDNDRQIVISQVHGGGGNTGAIYQNDYIELYNKGTAPVDLSGWSVQYTSAGGDSWSDNKKNLTGTIQPGKYFLIQAAAGNGCSGPCGSALPTADLTCGINMGASAGKVALVRSTDALTGECPKDDCRVVDFIGWGSANCFEGSMGAAPAGDNTNALVRKGGCTPQDGNDNQADFLAAAPVPHNSTSLACFCHSPLADADGDLDVDQDDFGAFQACFSGTNGGILTGRAYPCLCFNQDATPDNDVDVDDLNKFVTCAASSGPSIPAQVPPCLP